MNDANLKYSGAFSYLAANLGGLRSINPHRGMDGETYADIAFDRGSLSMSTDMLKDLVRRSQEALVAAESHRQVRHA